MKTTLIALASLFLLAPLHAQPTTPPATDKTQGLCPVGTCKKECYLDSCCKPLKKLKKLKPEERAKLHAAYEKASKDPNVQAKRTAILEAAAAYRQALHQAMIKADPSVQNLIQKEHEQGTVTHQGSAH